MAVVSENTQPAREQKGEEEDVLIHVPLSGLLVVIGEEGAIIPEATRRVIEMAARNRVRDTNRSRR